MVRKELKKMPCKTIRDRSTPRVWPNGSGLYEEGKAGNVKYLMGRTFTSKKDKNKVEAWSNRRGIMVKIGVFGTDLEARLAVARWYGQSKKTAGLRR